MPTSPLPARRRGGAGAVLLAVLLGLVAVPAAAGATATSNSTADTAGARAAAATQRYARFPQVVGHSTQGRPIVAHFRGDPTAEHQVVLLGQMHGDERAGHRTAVWVRKNLRPASGTGLWVVATMNPDGHARRTRANARGVDLNRNFPTSGWTHRGKGTCCYSGPRAGSEPETRAMVRFLREVKPAYIASVHQPFGVIAANDEDRAYERRLSRFLRLPIDEVSIGHGDDDTVAPSLTSWYNGRHGASGTSVTVELPRTTTSRYETVTVGNGLLRAMQVWQRPAS